MSNPLTEAEGILKSIKEEENKTKAQYEKVIQLLTATEKEQAKSKEEKKDEKDQKEKAVLYMHRAQAYLALGEHDKCYNDILTSMSLDPNNPTAYLIATKALQAVQKNDDAMEYCRQGYSLTKSNNMGGTGTQRELSDLLKGLMITVNKDNEPKEYTRKTGCPTYNFSVVVCQNHDGKLLAVKETRNRGWWLPAGFVDPGENFIEAAHRETLEEAGIKVKLEGVLRVEHSVQGSYHARMRVIFYARPVDNTPPKSKPDEESEAAAWVTIEELQKMEKKNQLRGPELLQWGEYLARGGKIFPMYVLTEEGDPCP